MTRMFQVWEKYKPGDKYLEKAKYRLEKMVKADAKKDEEIFKPLQDKVNAILAWEPDDKPDKLDNKKELTGRVTLVILDYKSHRHESNLR